MCFNFSSFVKNRSKFIDHKNNDTDDSEGCLLDEKNNATKIFEFATIPSLVAVTCSTSEPISFMKVVQKNVAKENLETDLDKKYFLENVIKGTLIAEV